MIARAADKGVPRPIRAAAIGRRRTTGKLIVA
jgi:hypothetical protein